MADTQEKAFWFPKQNLLDKDKDNDWRRQCVNSIIYTLGANLSVANQWYYNNSYQKYLMYNYFTGEIDPNDYSYVTNPLQRMQEMSSFTYPAKLRNYNIIKPVFEELKGEYQKRRFDFNVVAVNPDLVDQKTMIGIQKKVDAEVNQMLSQWKTMGIPVDHLMNDMSLYDSYFANGEKLPIEELCAKALEYLVYDTNFKEKSQEAFEHLGIADESIFRVYAIGEDVKLRVVNPVYVWYNPVHSSKYLDDCDKICELRWLSIAEILNEYQEYLTDAQVDWMEQSQRQIQNYGPASSGLVEVQYGRGDLWNYIWVDRGLYKFPVWSVEWISRKAVGRPKTTESSESYFGDMSGYDYDEINKPQKGKVKWINEVWEGVRIGGNIYLNINPRKTQFRKFTNPNDVSLSYCGVARTTFNSKKKSFVAYGVMYQEFYNIAMYKYEQAIANSKGKATVRDLAQIPRNENYSPSPELHEYFMQSPGIMDIDTSQLTDSGIRASNTVYTVLDRSNPNEIKSMMEAALFILQSWYKVVGMTEQRLGSVDNRETVGGVERAVTQSSYITEYLFASQAAAEQRALTKMLEVAKSVWPANKKLQFPIGEYGHKVFSNIKDFRFTDFSIYVSDNVEQKEKKSKLLEIAAQSVQGGNANLMDYVNIVMSSSLGEAKRKMEEAFAASQQAAQQQLQQEQQMAQQAAEMERQLEMQRMQLEDRLNLRDNQTKLMIAGMQGENAMNELEAQAEYDMQMEKNSSKKSNEESVSKDLTKKIQKEQEPEKGESSGGKSDGESKNENKSKEKAPKKE